MLENDKKNELLNESAKWKTSITKVEPDRLITRGYLQSDLIDSISFSDMVFLLLKNELPEENHSKMMDAILVAFCDHGVTPPSTQSARLIASAGSPLNSAVAGGLLGFGKNHSGAVERAMSLFQCVARLNFKEAFTGEDLDFFISDFDSKYLEANNEKFKTVANDLVYDNLKYKHKLPGFGHRYHKKDPRARKILEVANKYDCASIHTKLAIEIENKLNEEKGICLNVDGACAAILCDLGFDSKIGTGLFMIGRLPALIAHAHEEMSSNKGFRKFCNLDDIIYK